MEEFTKETGKKTKCTDLAYLNGQMADATKETTRTIRNMVKANILGQTDASTRERGKMGSSTDRESTNTPMATVEQESGSRAKEPLGSITIE